MHNRLALALSATLAAVVFPAATTQFSSDPVLRSAATPNITIRNPDGTSRAGLRCGVLARTPLQRDVLERNLHESRMQALAGSSSRRPGDGSVTIPVWFHIVTKTSRQGVVTGQVSDD